jgi:glycine/D-amino acid oxidase-like deaminating enzyme
MKDAIVVGSGFWGAAIARKLKNEGMDYAVIDHGDLRSGTRNSGAYTCLRWFSSGTVTKQLQPTWTKEKIEAWVNWLVRQEYLESVGQWIYHKRLDTWKRYDDCYLMKDVSLFSNRTKYVLHAKVYCIDQKKDHCVVATDSGMYKAHQVVLATGAWTDELLKLSGLSPIGVTVINGRAIIVEPTDKIIRKRIEWNNEVISVSVRPFKNYDLLRNAKDWWYFGATTERSESESAYSEMLGAAALVLGENVKVKRTLTGVRPIYSGGVVRVSERIIAATGGGRIGLALAGPAAEDVISLLKE